MTKYIELVKAKRFFENIDAGRVGYSTLLTPTEFAEYLDEIEPETDKDVKCAIEAWNRG